jgi:hypothetical protein
MFTGTDAGAWAAFDGGDRPYGPPRSGEGEE